MRRSGLLILLVFFLVCSGCYHARVETGATPSSVTIDESWSASWIFGLVPPKILETAKQCPNGVAKVATKLSFLNQVVGILTLGIYTPMDVRVTCAQGPSAEGPHASPDIVVSDDAEPDEVIEAFERAAEVSKRLERPVFVKF